MSLGSLKKEILIQIYLSKNLKRNNIDINVSADIVQLDTWRNGYRHWFPKVRMKQSTRGCRFNPHYRRVTIQECLTLVPVMADGIRTGDPRGFNNGRSSKFRAGSRVRQTPEEGRRIYQPKSCRNNNKYEDNSP